MSPSLRAYHTSIFRYVRNLLESHPFYSDADTSSTSTSGSMRSSRSSKSSSDISSQADTSSRSSNNVAYSRDWVTSPLTSVAEVEEDDETRDLTAMVVVSPASTEGLFKIVTISRKRLQGEKMCDTNGSEAPRRRTVLCNATNAMGENYPAKKGSGGARGHNDSEGENKTREEEHRRAWETDGKRVWRNIPSSFTLQLSDRRSSRHGSSDASSCCGARSDMVVHDNNTVSREPASKDVEGGKEKTKTDLTNANVSSLRYTLAMASPTRENQGIGRYGSCLDEDEDGDTVPIRDADTVPVQCEDGEEITDVMDRNGANSTKLQIEYESRRELRWNRKRAELVGNIERWWVVVCHEINWDVNQPMPIIPPNINSPSSLVTAPRASFPPVLCS